MKIHISAHNVTKSLVQVGILEHIPAVLRSCGLGDGQTHQTRGGFDCSPDPVQVMNLAGMQLLSAGGRHNCVSIAGDTAWCWGDNGAGQLGDGTTTGGATPVQVAGLSDVSVSACGAAHTRGVLLDGIARLEVLDPY